MKIIYFWACDYKNNTGEGRLARLYLAKISKEKKIFFKKIPISKSKILNMKYISPFNGIFHSWKFYFKNKNFLYLNYLPLWNFLIFLFLSPRSLLGPITGGANYDGNLIRKFIFPIFYFLSQIIISFRFKKIIFSTSLLKKKLLNTIKKRSEFNFILNGLKKKNNKTKKIDFLIYYREHPNKKVFFPYGLIRNLVKLNLKIFIVGDKLSIKGVKNLGKINNNKIQNLLSQTRYSIASGENIMSLFTIDCINNNVKILLNSNQSIEIKKFNKYFIKLNFNSKKIENKLKF